MRFLILFAIAGLALTAHASEEKKIVCYLASWATYRPGDGKFNIKDIDAKLCTHLIYSFVGIDDNNDIKILDNGLDINQQGYKRFNELRKQNPTLKTLVAVGGWNEASTHFSKMASSPSSRATFVKNVVAFVKRHNFDGFDVDWEYPAQREGSSPADVENFVILLKELRAAFDQENLLLSAAVAAAESSASKSYKIAEISKYLHFINLMTYDFHGAYDGKTGMNAALYAASSENQGAEKLNVDAVVKYWLSQGAPKDKLILGVPTYGRSFTVNSDNTAVGAPSSGSGNAGPYTREAGMLGYNEICDQHNKGGWQVEFDEERGVPYAQKGNQWVGYDDVKSVKGKAEYVKKMGLGGAMVWAIDTDDFKGTCGERYPLVKTLNHVLRNGQAVTEHQPKRPIASNDKPSATPNQQPESPSINNNDGTCTSSGIIPDPTTCKQFFHCDALAGGGYVKYTMFCPSGLCFKAESGVCDWQ